jgi:hypothetical protein
VVPVVVSFIGEAMSNIETIYKKALSSPNNLSFLELRRLIEGAGYNFVRQKGSHALFKHPAIRDYQDSMINVQDFGGKAKAYQVKILLDMIEKYGLLV